MRDDMRRAMFAKRYNGIEKSIMPETRDIYMEDPYKLDRSETVKELQRIRDLQNAGIGYHIPKLENGFKVERN